ncbi:PREDICTED: uncharacterized protein LOC105147010 [Acromyrmex echinatior]|uniref:uncharacterized protein LOC105147010 n=1 Tax=Acromyrmex echinatior TaxID=103372 RepID=UPI000580C669|nr:PREDICTED: uncharacterized protein LOC105147010 [Acromyrmex echinatior]
MKNLLTMGHQEGFLVFLIYLLRFCQVSHSIGLMIDNQLVIIANDCYTRIAIGSKLPDMDIFSNVAVGSISECEDECSKRRNSCNAFAFGIGMKGNGTCALSVKMPKPEDLQSHADYDVYVRSQRSPHCEPDRLYKMGSGSIGQDRRNETMPTTTFGSGFLGSTMPNILSSPRTMGNMMPNVNDPSYQRGYTPSFDDERRITDIVRNRNPISPTSNPFITNNAKVDYNDLSIYSNRKSAFGQRTHSDPKYNRPDFHGSFQNPFNDVNHLNFGSDLDNDLHSYKSLSVHNGPFEVFSRPIFIYDGASKDRSPANFGFSNAHDTTKHRVTNHFDQHRHQEFHNNVYKNPGIIIKSKQNELDAGNYDFRKVSSRPTISNLYGFDNEARIPNKGFKDTSEFWNPELMTMFRDFGTKITEKSKSCYRRLLSGKKSLDLHVRRAIECERLEDCHRACDYEKRFTCEGFNYRRIGHGTRGICEMTSVPYSRMNFHQDFISDPQCNYYEKDPNCVINTPETRPSWWNQPSRPGQSYGPPYYPNERPRPYAPDRRPLNEVPRPLDYDRRPLQEIPRPFDYDRRPSNEIPRPLDHRLAEHDRQPPIVYGYPHHRLHDDTFSRRNYPDSIRGGYPATRPEDRFIYSVRFPSRRPTDDDFYNRNPWTRYPSRRIDHDIGTNEIGSYLPDYRKDPTRDWSSYGSVYGGSYGYDTNYVGNFDIPKYHPKSQPKPYNNDQFYGEFYNYGGAFGYGDNYIPANQDSLYGGTTSTEECSVRAGAGFRLSRGVVRKTYLTSNLDQCENLCISEKSYVCMSFSYRYNVLPTDPTDNCLLSDVSYKDLNFYIDLEPDRDYDIYAIIVNSRTCSARREPSSHPPDECFWRVRSGFGMPTDVVRKSLIVNDLGECQAECMTMHDFMCRSFTFKYGLEHGRSDILTNCYLSDWPSQDINPTHMPDMDGAEVYERGSFGRGCEPYAVPFFNMERFNGKQMQGDEVCYSGYDKPCKLTPYAVLLATYVNSEQDCRQKCSKMRETDSVPCLSYSYKLTTHGTEENCLLSDVPIRDLRPGLDYTYDNDHVLYTWKDLDPYCVVSSYSPNDAHGLGGPNPPKPVLSDHSRPDFNLGKYPSLRPDDIYIDPRPFFTKPGSHGVRPFDPDKPDPVRPYPSGSYGYDGNKFGYGIYLGGFGSLYPDESSTFRYYTVNGYPCKRGTKCEKNKLAGFWACETEGGGFDSWDYCCAPTHHCGFSQGYHYPWCYVGLSEDQWRPCSEKYYPYLPSPRPFRPMIGSEDRYDRPNRPYDPNYYGRHWPITYLHREPPPNCTDSLASADNSGNRRLNETISTTIETPKSTTARVIKNDENNTMTTIRTRRRRLRVRTANDMRNDRNAIFSQKISSRIITNDATRTRENQTSWDRAGKIERVTRPTNTKPSLIMQTVTSFVTTNNVDDTQFEGVKNSDGMIKVPLIAPNRSLPVVRA